jgi:hypothetical protein
LLILPHKESKEKESSIEERAVEPGPISQKPRFVSQWHPLYYLFIQAKFYIQEGVGVHVVAESVGYAPFSETLRHQHNEMSSSNNIITA